MCAWQLLSCVHCSLPGSCPWNSSGKNTRVGCHFLLQGIFPTQGSNPGLLYCRQTHYHLSYLGSLLARRDYKQHHPPQINFRTIPPIYSSGIHPSFMNNPLACLSFLPPITHHQCLPLAEPSWKAVSGVSEKHRLLSDGKQMRELAKNRS